MGGADKALAVGEDAFNEGDYRWAATVFNHVVFADADNKTARKWLASTYEQLGFQAEAGTWRNIYLVGAKEIRDGNIDTATLSSGNANLLNNIPAVDLFDSIATRFNPVKMQRNGGIIQFNFPERNEVVSVDLNKSYMFPRAGTNPKAAGEVTISRTDFTKLLTRQATPETLVQSGAMVLKDDTKLMATMFDALDPVRLQFDIVTP